MEEDEPYGGLLSPPVPTVPPPAPPLVTLSPSLTSLGVTSLLCNMCSDLA